MAAIDPLDRLVQLARQEEPPPCGETAVTMRRIRALRGTKPAADCPYWKYAAMILAGSAAAAVVLVLLAGRARNGPSEPAGAGNIVKVKVQRPASNDSAANLSAIVPALDILGSLENEVNQLIGSVQSQRSAATKT